MSTDVLSSNQGSVSRHSRLDLESHTIVFWISWEVNSVEVNGPGLIETVVAIPEDKVSVVMVMTSVNIKTLSWDVSEISVWSTVVGKSLESFTLPDSDDSSSVSQESLTSLVRDGVVSSVVGSDCNSSSVEDPPLSWVPWFTVVNSESELISTDVLVPEDGFSSAHS